MLVTGDWVVPVSSAPLAGGAVLIDRGEIAAVGNVAELRARYPGAEVRAYPGCALLPGIVNAHTHLDYSAFQGFRPSRGFLRWIIRLTRARMKLDTDDLTASALWGAQECLRYGVTSIADASYGGSTVARAAQSVGLRARVYLEVFGLDDSRLGETLERLRAALEEVGAVTGPSQRPIGVDDAPAQADALVEWGISPHAPYTVSQALYREVARLARERGLSMATHLAESKTEVRMLKRGYGPSALFYKVLGLLTGRRLRLPGMPPLEYVAGADALGPDMLAVHAVQLDAEGVAGLARSGSPVAHCPRSNLRLGCGWAPVAEMRRAGVTVGLGTDSLASNDDLDMLAEMRAALAASREREARGGASALLPAEVLQMATLDGARALGWERLVGSLEMGKRADMAVVTLPAGLSLSPSSDALAEAIMRGRVRTTLVGGRVAYEGPGTQVCAGLGLDAVRAKIGMKV